MFGKVQLARHANDHYFGLRQPAVHGIWCAVRGSKAYADDKAILGGWRCLTTSLSALIGQHRGRSTRERIEYILYMAKPEGYQSRLDWCKWQNGLNFAGVLTLLIMRRISRRGAQKSVVKPKLTSKVLRYFLSLNVPWIATVIPVKGAVALAIGVADRINMLENSIYSGDFARRLCTILENGWKSAPSQWRGVETQCDKFKIPWFDWWSHREGEGAHINRSDFMTNLKATLEQQLAGTYRAWWAKRVCNNAMKTDEL